MPPVAKKIPHELEIHGDVRIDEYYWLRERDNPEVLAYLDAENAYTANVMAHTQGLQEKLFQELKGRTEPDEESVPYKYGDYYYYHRYEKGRDYPIYCRKKGSLSAAEQILLDVNKIAAGHEYFDVPEFEPSPDHKFGAFTVDTTGRYLFTLQFVDLESGEILPDQITNITDVFEWAADSRNVLYVQQDPETFRFDRVLRYEIGSNSPQLVYEEPDET